MSNNINYFQQGQIHISKLILDNENPRLQEIQESEAGCIKEITKHPNKKFFNLVEDICEYGLNPGEGLYLMPDDTNGNYIVLEGNRRVCALKLLHNPILAEGLISKAQSKKLSDLSDQFISDPIQVIQSVIFSDRVEADPWIVRKHQGENGGRGVVHWKNPEKNRHDERLNKFISPSTEFINYFIKNKTITDSEARNISLTNLNRIAEKSIVQSLLNYIYDQKNHVFKILDDGKFFDIVHGHVIKLLIQGKIKVSDVYSEAMVLDFIYNQIIPAIQNSPDQETIQKLNSHLKSKLDWVNESIRNKPDNSISFPDLGTNISEEETDRTYSDDLEGLDEEGKDSESTDTNTEDSEGEESNGEDSGDQSSSPDSSRNEGENQVEENDQPDDDPTSEEDDDADEYDEEEADKKYEDTFKSIRKMVKNSKIEDDLKKIIDKDLSNAQKSHNVEAWKACTAMLGTSLEGVMLGTLIREDVLDYVITNRASRTLGKFRNLYNPNLENPREKILENDDSTNTYISFEILKKFIADIIPMRKDFDPGKIQQFRNMIHPAVSLREKNIKIGPSRVNSLLTDCKLIIQEILSYCPPDSGQIDNNELE